MPFIERFSFSPFLLKGVVLCCFLIYSCTPKPQKVDVLVIGGGTAGTAAAVSSARQGVTTVLLNAQPWLGGMLTAAGVSAVDGNTKLPSGFWGEFRDSLIGRYGSEAALKTGWVSNSMFEPEVGAAIFKNITAKEPLLKVYNTTQWTLVQKHSEGWEVQAEQAGGVYTFIAKELIDATELGDVAASLGVAYYLGMDSRSRFQEDIAPETPNTIVQDLTYVVTLQEFDAPAIIERPEGYDPSVFYCATANPKCEAAKMQRVLWEPEKMITYGALPNKKYMINWPINGNDYYTNAIEMSAAERGLAFEAAKRKTKQFVYYLQTELGFDHLGVAKDIYPTADGFPLIPYHRESRRIQGVTTLTLNHISKPFEQKDPLYRTGIAVGDYPVDHHHDAKPETVAAPELYFYPVPSYNIPLGVMIPKEEEHLLVTEKSISVSNIVNGTTRLQPVVLQLGQAAGITAALAVKQKTSPRTIAPRLVQEVLLNEGGYLFPYLDVPKQHPFFKAYQRIGATGILKGTGKNVGWENQMWFYSDQPLNTEEVFLEEWEGRLPSDFPKTTDVQSVLDWCKKGFSQGNAPEWLRSTTAVKYHFKFENFTPETTITRGQFAVLIDALFHPFQRQLNHFGQWEE